MRAAATGTGTGAFGLAVAGVRYRVVDAELLRDVWLHAAAGTVTGVLGPNGSGKSTLLRLVIGALRPDSGMLSVTEDGTEHDLLRMRGRDRARRLALVEQDASTDLPLLVREVVELGRIPWNRSSSPTGDADAVADAVARTRIEPLLGRHFDTLSGGERQRVQLARALAQQPRALLLDEPTNHLDLAAQLALLALIREVADTGVCVLIAMHDLAHAAQLCDRVVVLERGEVVAHGEPRATLTPDLLARVWRVRGEWVHGSPSVLGSASGSSSTRPTFSAPLALAISPLPPD